MESRVCRIGSWGLPPRRARVWAVRAPEHLSRIDDAPWIARGMGRSYADQALAPRIADLTPLAFFLAWDARRGRVRAEAGVTFADLIQTFLPRGFFPPVTPGTRWVSLGGAIAANVHGKNHHRDGDLSRWVRSLRVWFPGEGMQRITPEDPRFSVVVGSLGLVGVIVDVEMDLLPVPTAWIRSHTIRVRDLEHLMDTMATRDTDHRYAVAWVDGFARGARLGKGVVFFGDHARLEDLSPRNDPWDPGPRPRHLPLPWIPKGGILSPPLMRAYAAWYYDTHPSRESVVHASRFFYPLDGVDRWNRLYGNRGMVQIQVVVPGNTLPRILETLCCGGPLPPYLVVVKRMGKSQGLLGFGLEGGWTVAADYPRISGVRDLALRVYRMTAEAGGRVYLTKDAFLTPDLMAAMYPVETFRSWKARLDPRGVLCSDFGRRVGLC